MAQNNSLAFSLPPYWGDTSPEHIRFCLLLAGVIMPDGSLDCLEIGCGQGLSAVMHAAATEHVFCGLEPDARAAATTARLAQASGVPLRLEQCSFRQFSGKTDLPQFDLIILRNVWSRLAEPDRKQVVKTLRDRLKPGGAVCIGYDALPGWSLLSPLRQLLMLHVVMSQQGGSIEERFSQAVALACKQAEAGGFFAAAPPVRTLLESMAANITPELAAQWLSAHWRPFYAADVQHVLGQAQLQYVSSARLLQQIDVITLPPALREALDDTAPAAQKETVRDFVCNQTERLDIFVKGARTAPSYDLLERQGETVVCLAVHPDQVPDRIRTPAGDVKLDQKVYAPLIKALADENYRPKSVNELEDHAALTSLDSARIMEAVTILAGAGAIRTASPSPSGAVVERCRNLNATLCRQARGGDVSLWLASPVCGCGVPVGRFEQMFLLSDAEGRKSTGALADDVCNQIYGWGEVLKAPDGTPLKHREGRAAMKAHAATFVERRLPFLRALGIELGELK